MTTKEQDARVRQLKEQLADPVKCARIFRESNMTPEERAEGLRKILAAFKNGRYEWEKVVPPELHDEYIRIFGNR